MLPRDFSYWLASFIAARMASGEDSEIVSAIRQNQAVVRGLSMDHPSLEEIVRKVLFNTTRGFVDVFRAMIGGPEVVLKTCSLEERLERVLTEGISGDRGLIVIGPHLAGFDIFLLWLGTKGYPIQTLSYADPRGSYTTQNEIRQKFGLNITPVSVSALRLAMRQLLSGNAILTAVDRGIKGGELLNFFGQKAPLPIGHARLAVQTGSPILIGIPHHVGDSKYVAEFGALIEPKITGDRIQDAINLAQEVISVIETFIRKWPDQWLMFHEVWDPEGVGISL
jgi:KDO2-lipid IV(A) lauroyltransferase